MNKQIFEEIISDILRVFDDDSRNNTCIIEIKTTDKTYGVDINDMEGKDGYVSFITDFETIENQKVYVPYDQIREIAIRY